MEESLSLLFHGESRASQHWNFLLRNAGAISLSSNEANRNSRRNVPYSSGYHHLGVLSLIEMLLAFQEIRLTFLLEKPLHVLTWTIPYQSLQGAISLLFPRKPAVTTLNLHQCENNVLGRLSYFPCLQQTKGKYACSDGVCQTCKSFEIYYSKINNPTGRQRMRSY